MLIHIILILIGVSGLQAAEKTKSEGCELCSFVIGSALAKIDRTKESRPEGTRAILEFIALFLNNFNSDISHKDLGKGTAQWIVFWDRLQTTWEERIDKFTQDDRQRTMMHTVWNEVGDWMEEAVAEAARVVPAKDLRQ
ncbi:unnamed protein product, partial [Mesorhabditis spiculigera]